MYIIFTVIFPWLCCKLLPYRNPLLLKETPQHLVPCMLQRFIQGKNAKGGAADTVQGAAVVAHVQEESVDVGGLDGESGLTDQGLDVVWGETEDDLEGERRVLSFYKLPEERTDAFPERVAALLGRKCLCFCVAEIVCMKASVDVKGRESRDCDLGYEKCIKGIEYQKLFHKIF